MGMRSGSLVMPGMMLMMVVVLTNNRRRRIHRPMPDSAVQRTEQNTEQQHPGKQRALLASQFHRTQLKMAATSIAGRAARRHIPT